MNTRKVLYDILIFFFFFSLKQDIFKLWKLNSNRVVKILLYKNKISQEKYKY